MLFLDNLSSEERKKATVKLQSLGKKTKKYYILTILSVIIATLGLLIDNTAVIIGAMLISPLMDPILCLSNSIVTGRSRSLNRTFQILIKGITLSIIIAILITTLIPIYEIPTEVLNRSNPSIIDLFIAITAGAAAMYATIKNDKLATLPGVGISVSLMPPLSVIGIGLGIKDYTIASGASILFLTNLVAIIFSGTIFLFLFGFKPRSKDDKEIVRKSAYTSILLLTGLSIILTSSFINISSSEKRKVNIKNVLVEQLGILEKGELSSFSLNQNEEDELVITAKVLNDKNLTQEEMDILSSALAKKLGESIKLKVTIIPTLSGGKTLTEQEKIEIKKEIQEEKEASDSANLLEKITSKIASPSAEEKKESKDSSPSSELK